MYEESEQMLKTHNFKPPERAQWSTRETKQETPNIYSMLKLEERTKNKIDQIGKTWKESLHKQVFCYNQQIVEKLKRALSRIKDNNNLLKDSNSINNTNNSNNNSNNKNSVNLDESTTVACSKTAPPGSIFSVDYSKRGTTKCKVCNKIIDMHQIRIDKLVPYKKTVSKWAWYEFWPGHLKKRILQ